MIEKLIEIANKEFEESSHIYMAAKADWDMSWMSTPAKKSQLEQALYDAEKKSVAAYAALEFLKRIREKKYDNLYEQPKEDSPPEVVAPVEEKTHYILRIPKYKKFCVLHGSPQLNLKALLDLKVSYKIEDFSIPRCEELSNAGYTAI